MATIPPKPVLGEPRSAVTADGEVPWASAVVDALQAHDDDLVVLNALAIDDDGVTLVVTDSIRSVDMAAALTQVAASSAPGAVAPTATQTLFAWDSTTELPIMVTRDASPTAISGWRDGTGNNRNFRRWLVSEQEVGLFFPFAMDLIGFSVSSNLTRTSGSTAVAAVVNGSVSGTAVATYNSGRSASWTGSLAVPAGQEFTFNQVTSSHLPASQLEITAFFVRS